MEEAEGLDFTDESLGKVSVQLVPGPDSHLTYRWASSTSRNITLHSIVMELYSDGRWVSIVDIQNVSRHSNWDVWMLLYWQYSTGHVIYDSRATVFSTAINHGHRRTERQIGKFAWLSENFEFIQRPDIDVLTQWSGRRNN